MTLIEKVRLDNSDRTFRHYRELIKYIPINGKDTSMKPSIFVNGVSRRLGFPIVALHYLGSPHPDFTILVATKAFAGINVDYLN